MKGEGMPKVGDRYTGFGKTWEVVRVHPEGAVDARNVDNHHNTIRWPLAQFKEMRRDARRDTR